MNHAHFTGGVKGASPGVAAEEDILLAVDTLLAFIPFGFVDALCREDTFDQIVFVKEPLFDERAYFIGHLVFAPFDQPLDLS